MIIIVFLYNMSKYCFSKNNDIKNTIATHTLSTRMVVMCIYNVQFEIERFVHKISGLGQRIIIRIRTPKQSFKCYAIHMNLIERICVPIVYMLTSTFVSDSERWATRPRNMCYVSEAHSKALTHSLDGQLMSEITYIFRRRFGPESNRGL